MAIATAGKVVRAADLARALVAVALVALFSLTFYRTAWVTEDAFITLRVVDNALNGLGLVWNPGERVQVYTHPLWFGLLVPTVATLGDPYYAALLLSYGLLLATLWLLWRTVDEWRWPALAAVVAMLWSRSFWDYSSSGLENPLTHALLAGFVWAWLKLDGRRQTLALSLITSGLFLSRPDAVVLVAPAMAWHLWRTRHFREVAMGAAPSIAWVAFSLFYYGAPVPNTALAKVATGLPFSVRAEQAQHYIGWVLTADPVTAVLIVAGVVAGLASRKTVALSAGLPLFVAYLFYVGGDYMVGRFFSGPIVMAMALICTLPVTRASKVAAAALGLFLLSSAWRLDATVFSSPNFTAPVTKHGLSDERGTYYAGLGLVPVLQHNDWQRHGWFAEGKRSTGPGWHTRCAVGIVAYSAGPQSRWIDPLALTEPFLARLPAREGARVGHYERAFPAGYLASMVSGENHIAEPALHALYADVDRATRAPLLSAGRAGAIWRLNTGAHRHAADGFDRNAIGLPGKPVETRSQFSCFGIPYGRDGTWRIDGIPPKAEMIGASSLTD